MVNYFLRPGGAYVRIDEDTQTISLVLNLDIQKTVSFISNNPEYYNKTLNEVNKWTISDQVTFDNNRNEVLAYLNNK